MTKATTKSGRRYAQRQDCSAPVIADPEVEDRILGSLLQNNDHYHANPSLAVGLFSTDIRRVVFRRMAAMFEDAVPVDTTSLPAELRTHGELDLVGGEAYIHSLSDCLAPRKNIAHWVKIASEQSRLRQLAACAEAWTNSITAAGANSKTIAQQIIEETGTLLHDADVDDWRSLFHTHDEFQNAPPLQFAINGFLQEAGITLIGGLSGHGKTLIMLSMARALLEETPLFGYELFSVPRPAQRVCISCRNHLLVHSGHASRHSVSRNTFAPIAYWCGRCLPKKKCRSPTRAF